MTSWLARIRNAFRSEQVADEIEREMAFHIDQRADDLAAAGMSPRAARTEARRRFGNVARHHDDTRDRDLFGWLASLFDDVRYALRLIRVRPGPSIVIGLTLAFGLGVNATVLGIMDGLLLRPYQFPDIHRLVVLWDTRAGATDKDAVSPGNFLDWREQATRVERLVAWEPWSATAAWAPEPERMVGFRVSPGFFELIGLPPTVGRSFTADEEQEGHDRTVVISDGLWKRRFGSNPGVVGSHLILDDVAYTIVGIAPPNLDFPTPADVWAPLAFPDTRATDRTSRTLTVMGALAPGASRPDAQAELDVIAARLATLHPDANRGRSVAINTLSQAFVERASLAVNGVLQTAAALVLLVACANLAGLMLARSLDRRRELAVRIALGASRRRIVRQLATETVVLSLLASVLAILCAQAAIALLRSSVPADIARYVEGWNNVRVSGLVLAFIPLVAIAIGLLVAIFPALSALRSTSTAFLKESDRGAISTVATLRGRQMLVVAEIAFALAILIGATVTVRGGTRLVTQPGGFETDGLLRLAVTLPEAKYRNADTRVRFVDAVTERLGAIPGVAGVTVANVLPASGWSPDQPVLLEDRPCNATAVREECDDERNWPRAGFRSVSDDFFTTMRIGLTSGRSFSRADRDNAAPVAMVSAAFAARYWPHASAIGKRLKLGDTSTEWRTIVGVAADVNMYNWWDGIDYQAVYVPLRQLPPAGFLHAVIRTHAEPTAVTAAVRAALHEVDPTLPIEDVRTMRQAIVAMSQGLQLVSTLMAVCGGVALLLATIGIYGLMSYTFAQRSHEFGVRLAFGATAADVLRLTLRRAVALTGIGLAIGIPLAWMLTRAMSSAFQGMVALEPLPFIGVSALLAIASLASAYVPARRALRLNPATILRS